MIIYRSVLLLFGAPDLALCWISAVAVLLGRGAADLVPVTQWDSLSCSGLQPSAERLGSWALGLVPARDR
jgi:hypothetical protein